MQNVIKNKGLVGIVITAGLVLVLLASGVAASLPPAGGDSLSAEAKPASLSTQDEASDVAGQQAQEGCPCTSNKSTAFGTLSNSGTKTRFEGTVTLYEEQVDGTLHWEVSGLTHIDGLEPGADPIDVYKWPDWNGYVDPNAKVGIEVEVRGDRAIGGDPWVGLLDEDSYIIKKPSGPPPPSTFESGCFDGVVYETRGDAHNDIETGCTAGGYEGNYDIYQVGATCDDENLYFMWEIDGTVGYPAGEANFSFWAWIDIDDNGVPGTTINMDYLVDFSMENGVVRSDWTALHDATSTDWPPTILYNLTSDDYCLWGTYLEVSVPKSYIQGQGVAPRIWMGVDVNFFSEPPETICMDDVYNIWLPASCVGEVDCSVEISIDGLTEFDVTCFEPGDTIYHTIRFRDSNGKLANPDLTTLHIVIHRPGDDDVDVTGYFTNPSIGIWVRSGTIPEDAPRGERTLEVTATFPDECQVQAEKDYEIWDDCDRCSIEIEVDSDKICFNPGETLIRTIYFRNSSGVLEEPSYMVIHIVLPGTGGFPLDITDDFTREAPGVYKCIAGIPSDYTPLGTRTLSAFAIFEGGCEATAHKDYQIRGPAVRLSVSIEDALEGVRVNKVAGDSDAPAGQTVVDIVTKLTSRSSLVKDDISVVLSIPGDLFGAPTDTWVRDTTGGALTDVACEDLGAGQYRITTDLSPRVGIQQYYYKQVVWRFQIPNDTAPQDVTVSGYVQMQCETAHTTGTIRIMAPGAASCLIVANRKLLYDNYTEDEVTSLLQRLYTEAQGTPASHSPQAVVYYVDRYSNPARDWDNTAVDYTSGATANAVANAIDDLIEDWDDDATQYEGAVRLSDPQYLLIVGDDDTIPFYRYDDPFNGEGVRLYDCDGDDVKEHNGWCVDSNDNPAVRATDEDCILTDNIYADRNSGTTWQTGDIELWVGRLLGETASDMLSLLREGVSQDNGRRGGVVMASVDGWELGLEPDDARAGEIADLHDVTALFRDKGFAVRNDDTPAAEVRTIDVMRERIYSGSHTGADNVGGVLTDDTKQWVDDALIGSTVYNTADNNSRGTITDNDATTVTANLWGGWENDWDQGDSYQIWGFEGGHTGWNTNFRNAANDAGGMDLFFIGGHNGYELASIPGDDFSPDDTPDSYTRFGADHPIAMIVGCHGGLPVPDIDVDGGADNDMVYDLIHEGARAYIGATGFSYGSPNDLHECTWGERLIQRFFNNLLSPAGAQSMAIGRAMAEAKSDYVFGHGGVDSLDRKTMTEFNLYGVPWTFIFYPAGGVTAPALTAGETEERAFTAFSEPIVRSGADVYSRTLEVDIASYEVKTETQDDIDYDLFSIEGGDLAVADGTPILPYIEGYRMPLPFGATVTNVEVVDSTSSSIGTYNIPTALVSPWTEGGLTYTTETDIDYSYPVDEDLVQYQETSEGLLFTVFPIRHNPTTDETTFYSRFVIEVTYESPLPVVVTEFTTDKEQYVPGEEISTTARIENVGDVAATLTATLTIRDALGEVMGTQTAGEFSVPSGGWHVLPLAYSGPLDDGAYTAQITIESDSDIVGGASTFVSLLGGEITDFSVPVTLDVGEEGTFQVTFANYRDFAVSGEVTLNIQDSEGGLVEELAPQAITVAGSSTETATFTWTPTDIATGDYNAVAAVAVDGQDYGPTARAFAVWSLPGPTVTWNFPSTSDVFLCPTPANNRPYLDTAVNLPTGTEPGELSGVYWLDEATGEWQYFIPGFVTSTLTSLEPGENYLVAVSGACSWNVPCGEGVASPTGNIWNFGSTSDVFLCPTPVNNRPYLNAAVNLPTGTEPGELSGVYWLDEATGEWQYFIPGFVTSTLTSLEPGEAYLVAVSGGCSWQLS